MNNPRRKQTHPPARLQPAAGAQPGAAPAAQEPYCTLFLCTLEQLTAISLGGRDDDADNTLHDLPLVRDGQGRPVLTGRTLAGALVATARTFLEVPDDVSLIGGAPDDMARPPSLWSVWNAHPVADVPTDSRPGNALRHDTRAPASHMLFDTEVLPPGQSWQLLIEVWHPRPVEADNAAAGATSSGRRAAATLALALQEWARGRCWLGRRVARGLGWMHLRQCQVIELPRTKAAVDAWPKADLGSLDRIFNHLQTLKEHAPNRLAASLDDYLQRNEANAGPKKPQRAFVRWPLTLSTGAYLVQHDQQQGPQSYGMDVLSLGGHRGSAVSAEDLKEGRLLRAPEQRWEAYTHAFAPDFAVAVQPGSVVPDVPGSAIAGAWRHFLSRLARAAGQAVLDPATGQSCGGGTAAAGADGAGADAVTPLFGFVLGDQARASALLIRDASMVSATDWKVALLEKVALDEFSQGAFKGAKFNRMAVFGGKWRFELVQEVALADHERAHEELPSATALVHALLDAAEQRRVAIGGGEFRAYGHLPVTVDAEPGCQWALAGEAWSAWPPQAPQPLPGQAGQAEQAQGVAA